MICDYWQSMRVSISRWISIEICSLISRSSKTTKERNKNKKNRIPSCQSHTHFFVYKKKKNPGNVRIREKMKIQSSQKEEHKNFPFFLLLLLFFLIKIVFYCQLYVNFLIRYLSRLFSYILLIIISTMSAAQSRPLFLLLLLLLLLSFCKEKKKKKKVDSVKKTVKVSLSLCIKPDILDRCHEHNLNAIHTHLAVSVIINAVLRIGYLFFT